MNNEAEDELLLSVKEIVARDRVEDDLDAEGSGLIVTGLARVDDCIRKSSATCAINSPISWAQPGMRLMYVDEGDRNEMSLVCMLDGLLSLYKVGHIMAWGEDVVH